MIRLTLVSILIYLCFSAAYAQRDTTVYYLNTSGKVVSTKDSAYLFLVILPPDTSIDAKLFIVKEFYSNGKLGLIGNSTTNTLANLKFQGSQITFFQNGHKKIFQNFENGNLVGDITEYYPNGRLYCIRRISKYGTKVFLIDCNDSTGTKLAENGRGKWINFLDDSFKKNYVEGNIHNGLAEGEWHGMVNDSIRFISIYNKGVLSTTTMPNSDGAYSNVEIEPEFSGGISAFMKLIEKNLRYPPQAKKNNTSGKVLVTFVIEKDGSITNVRVARGIGDGCDEEAVRVIKLSPPWKPGMQKGRPVRVAYSVPIGFR